MSHRPIKAKQLAKAVRARRKTLSASKIPYAGLVRDKGVWNKYAGIN